MPPPDRWGLFSFGPTMKLTQIQNEAPPEPPGTLMLPATTWASNWSARPTQPVLVGLKLLSHYDKRQILQNAKEFAKDLEDERSMSKTEAYDEALMRLLVAHGICDPNDSSKDSSILPEPVVESVFSCLTESGARFIFDAVQKLEVEESPRFREADWEEVVVLVETIGDGALALLSERDRSAALRHLHYVLNILQEAEAEATDTDQDDAAAGLSAVAGDAG